MSSAAAEAVEAVILTNLAATLKSPTLTDAELTDMATYWSGLNGHLATEARHLIDELFEFRQAFRRAATALGDDHIDVTPDNCGLGNDLVARVLYLRAQLAEAMELLTDTDRADLAQYDRPLRSVAS